MGGCMWSTSGDTTIPVPIYPGTPQAFVFAKCVQVQDLSSEGDLIEGLPWYERCVV